MFIVEEIVAREILDSRGNPVTKYNRLLRIEEELEGVASYPGAAAFPRRPA